MVALVYHSSRGRPQVYDPESLLTLIPKGRWASWKTLCLAAADTFGMSPRTTQRLLRQLRRDGFLVLNDHLYHRIR